jgi:type I restriction enzyme S subunit
LPVIDQGESFIGGYTNNLSAQISTPLPLIVFGDHTRRFKLIEKPFAVGADGVKLIHAENTLWNINFAFHQLLNLNLENRGYGRHYQYLRKESFLLPPLNEQVRIANKLEELFSDLDAGVNELKAAQAKLVQYRQSLLKAAVEGELSREWRESRPADAVYETGTQLLERILTERRKRWEEKQLAKFAEQGKQPPKDWQKKYPEPLQPDISDLPKLPDGWVWATVDQLGIVQLGRQRSPAKMHGVNPVKYIRAANITETGINLNNVLEMDFSEKEIETFRLKKGDILLTEASGSPEHVGRPAIWTKEDDIFCFQNTVIRFRSLYLNTAYAFYMY